VMDHYTQEWKIRVNDRRVARKQKMFAKYVKSPLISDGLRLDTVITTYSGDFLYEYSQTINTQPLLKSVEVSLDGDIYKENTRIYSIPKSEPLTFYVSSLSTFVDDREKFKTYVVERSVSANSICWIDFDQGSAKVDTSLGNNNTEIARIQRILDDLTDSDEFIMDSILVIASCSPEGNYQYNETLSRKRSESVTEYFRKREYQNYPIDFISRNVAENWAMFKPLVEEDPVLTPGDKNDILQIASEPDFDTRDKNLSTRAYYKYLRETVYPKLRTVKFNFYMHRTNMAKDTIHTTLLDTVYMKGVQAIKDRDYKTALALLRPYGDFNTAVVYCALDYNASAMTILQSLEKTDKTEYMLSILFARARNDNEAVQHYLNACQLNRSYIHRGNLDPEISALIKKYELNKM